MSAHWFDRLATTVAADGPGVSRRTVFKGAAVTAVAASPLMSPRVARAGIGVEAAALTAQCNQCIVDAINKNNADVRSCLKTGALASAKKPKKPAKKPVSVLQQAACVMQAHANSAVAYTRCRYEVCQNDGAPPLQPDPNGPAAPPQGQSACPAGTKSCAGTDLCCFGNDLCCGCASTGVGVICCAAAVGCNCCG